MIRGLVTEDGDSVVNLELAARQWQAIVDTGFNGDLELPSALEPFVEARYRGQVLSQLAGGQSVLEHEYAVRILFDGESHRAVATFVPGDTILIGTNMLRRHRLDINFVAQTVLLERVA